MGLFRRTSDDDSSLLDVWKMLGPHLGLAVEERGDRSIRATGTVRDRAVVIEIGGRQKGSEFFRAFAEPSRNRTHQRWHTELRVACANPDDLKGEVWSAVDTKDPAWNPRVHDPSQCRKVWTEPFEIAPFVLSPALTERLGTLQGDTCIRIEGREVRIVEDTKASRDSGFAVGCFVHQPPGPKILGPERVLAGPPFWIDLLCDVADTVDGLTR